MSETETQNPNDSIPPDPLLDPGSFIEPNDPKPEHVVIAAQPLSIVSPDGTPISMRATSQHGRRSAEEMAKRPGWLPDDFRIDLRVRSSGATAGLIDRLVPVPSVFLRVYNLITIQYYVAPSGLKFRSKTEVLHFVETGTTKQKKRKFAPEGEAGSSGSISNGKQNTGVKRKSSSSALKSDNNVAPTSCL